MVLLNTMEEINNSECNDVNENLDVEKLIKKPSYIQHELNVPNGIPVDDFVFIDEHNLDKGICEEIIDLFKKDYRREKGVVGNAWTVNEKVKDTTEIAFSIFNEAKWKKIDKILFESLNKVLYKYMINLGKYNIRPPSMVVDMGYQIQKYEKNKGKYLWHDDSASEKTMHRWITFIWYLNDVEEGGETSFLHGKIKPTAGKLLMFPAEWTYLHRGCMPISDDKYIITGWLFAPNL